MAWRRERPPTPVFWPREFHGLYNPWDHKDSDTTEQLSPEIGYTAIRMYFNITLVNCIVKMVKVIMLCVFKHNKNRFHL